MKIEVCGQAEYTFFYLIFRMRERDNLLFMFLMISLKPVCKLIFCSTLDIENRLKKTNFHTKYIFYSNVEIEVPMTKRGYIVTSMKIFINLGLIKSKVNGIISL